MKDLYFDLDVSHLNSDADEDIRSPRTPTYTPSMSNFFSMPPFDPSRILESVTPPQSPKQPLSIPPLPAKPLTWVWQCHLCRSRYPLGATRRCLVDGHYYCSGEVDRPNLKKKKKGQSCSSEFDYIGWKDIADWQMKARNVVKTVPPREPRGCENCKFPSQCRYENHSLVGGNKDIITMADIDLSVVSSSSSAESADSLSRFYKNDSVTFESILASTKAETSKPVQSKVTDFYKPDRKKSQSRSSKSINKGMVLKEVLKAVEKRSGMPQALLSPIQEEFLQTGTDQVELERA